MLMAKNWLNNRSGVNKKEQIKLLRCEIDKKGELIVLMLSCFLEE